jgi:lactoylglutathione lyase
MDVIHTAIWVSDVDRTVEFYCEGLALDTHWEFTADGVRNLYIGGESGEIQLKYAEAEATESSESTAGPADSERGYDHLALGVEDVDAAFAQLSNRCDPPVVKPPTTVESISRRIAFVEDPDGYVVELVERLD